jgi:hypothetical protein
MEIQMTSSTSKKPFGFWIGFGASMALGLILLTASVGKLLLGLAEFSGVVVLYTFLPENLARMVSYVVAPAELVIAVFLFTGLYPKVVALLSLPMSVAFAVNNVWLIGLGMKCPTCPQCFGKFEEIFGLMTTSQALGLDIAMFILAIVLLVTLPGGFFSHRPWWKRIKSGDSGTID